MNAPASDGLQYVILPGKPSKRFAAIDLYNAIYDFWEQLWDAAFRQSGTPDPHWRDAFLKQDVLVALLRDETIVGSHSYTFYNLAAHATRKDSYFAILPPAVFEYLSAQKYVLVETMEYLCINLSTGARAERCRSPTCVAEA
jgi:hypothetical protein